MDKGVLYCVLSHILLCCAFALLQIHFTHHVQPIIEEVDFDVEATNLDVMVIEVYDPSSSMSD